MWNKMTLRCRLTLLTALILAAVCVGLTYFSIANAGLAFSTPSIIRRDFTFRSKLMK